MNNGQSSNKVGVYFEMNKGMVLLKNWAVDPYCAPLGFPVKHSKRR
jgi:hypothetical protein